MNYWLDLFTGNTWKEFQVAGSKVTGFREHNWKRAANIKKGDTFLCYLVGVKRWVGLLEVTGDRQKDDSPIFQEEVFPVRFPVKPLVVLTPEQGVPMDTLKGKLSFYPSNTESVEWTGYVRGSPTKYKVADGEVIATAIRAAKASPVERPVDAKKLARSANLYKLRSKNGDKELETVVSVPSAEDEDEPTPAVGPTHTEIQWRLLDLGSQLRLKVWAPKADRGKMWGTKRVGDVPSMLSDLPNQFDRVTNRTIADIDVLWLSGQTIVAAFEVEHTTSIYSGLLRMSDLITMQPNLNITFYLAAPDERYDKFCKEVARATFALRQRPLHTICRFLAYSKLCTRLEAAKDMIRFIRADSEFLDEIADLYDPAAEVGD
jgi:hypothetical protein